MLLVAQNPKPPEYNLILYRTQKPVTNATQNDHNTDSRRLLQVHPKQEGPLRGLREEWILSSETEDHNG